VIALALEDVADLRRWLISGAVVVLAHGALAGAMFKWHQEVDADEVSGAIVIEFAPAPVGPAVQNPDIPPGPEQVMSEAVPDQPPERAQEKTEQKVETPPPPEPPPEVKPAPNPEVPVEPPVTQEVKPEPRQEPRPPVLTTTAPQAVPTQTAVVPAAPVQGRPAPKVSTAIPAWTSRLAAALERNKRYPPAAQARREQGVAQVFFTLDRQGHLVESRIVRSSGAPILDEEALALLARAQPFPPPPAELTGPQVGLTVPIRFNLK
jgi:periplasmic protein TonB